MGSKQKWSVKESFEIQLSYSNLILFPGQIKYIHQENSTHTDIQLSQITLCRDVGSSCLSCQDKEDDIHDKVCQQQFREERLWVIGDNGRDLVMDSFWLPDGCQCVEVEVK